MKIVVQGSDYFDVLEHGVEYLKSISHIEIVKDLNKTEFTNACIGADIVVGHEAKFDAEFFKKCPTVKMIMKWGVGINDIDLDAATASGVIVCNCPHYGDLEVAEWAFIMTLNYVRKFMISVDSMKKTGWGNTQDSAGSLSMRGLTVGVLGLGRIGNAYARMMAPFGAKVLAYSINSKITDDMKLYTTQVDSVEEVLENSDIISLHISLNNQTEKFIDEKKLAMMKKSCVLVNVSRGGLVDETAIYNALEKDELDGYVADVFCNEPIEKDNPLQNHPKTLLTPHMAYFSKQGETRLDIEAIKGIANFINNEKLVSVVNGDMLIEKGFDINMYPYGELPYDINTIE